jgi:hypothetical protein
MCPVIEGADLTSVSTEFEPYPENNTGYKVTILSSALSDDKKQLQIKTRIEEPEEFNGRPYTDFINLVQNDGKKNTIGHTTIKRYMEAVFGKGSAEAESNPPNTDLLNGHQALLFLEINEYKPKGWKEGDALKKNNKTKKILPAQ